MANEDNGAWKWLFRQPIELYHIFREWLSDPEPVRPPVIYRVKEFREGAWADVYEQGLIKDHADYASARSELSALRQAGGSLRAQEATSTISTRANPNIYRIEAIGEEARQGEGTLIVLTRPKWHGSTNLVGQFQNWLSDIVHDRQIRRGRIPVIEGKITSYVAQYHNGSQWMDFESHGSSRDAIKAAKILRSWSRKPDSRLFLTDKDEVKRTQKKIPPAAFSYYSYRVVCRNDLPEQGLVAVLSKPNREEKITIRVILALAAMALALVILSN
jgi:hypothetical protein